MYIGLVISSTANEYRALASLDILVSTFTRRRRKKIKQKEKMIYEGRFLSMYPFDMLRIIFLSKWGINKR